MTHDFRCSLHARIPKKIAAGTLVVALTAGKNRKTRLSALPTSHSAPHFDTMRNILE